MNKFKIRDVIVIAAIAAAALLIYLLVGMGRNTEGGCVEVKVGNELYGTYSLGEDQTVEIKAGGKGTNVLEIKGGKASMVKADCPDLLCVHQGEISKVHETIVCLPNKVVVEVTEGETAFDAVAE